MAIHLLTIKQGGPAATLVRPFKITSVVSFTGGGAFLFATKGMTIMKSKINKLPDDKGSPGAS